jgi:putative tricarboxylic transport membrane protein
MLEALLSGFAVALQPMNVAYIAFGIVLGYAVGVLPGLNRSTAIALMIPITFYMEPVTAVSFLIGIMKGSASGGAVTAILINTPGEPSSAATCLDGYPLARMGKAEKALKVALIGSVFGDIFATMALIGVAQPLAKLALLIGPFELAAILIFALTFIAGLSGKSLIKGLISGMAGILLSCPGVDIETGAPRLVFGFIELYDGIPLLAVAIGMLALPEVFSQLEEPEEKRGLIVTNALDHSGITREDARLIAPVILRSSIIGTIVGVIPGLGAAVGSFMAYGFAKRFSKTPELFGHGALEGVAASETADNAVVPASLIPLFAIGIPGSVSAALLIGAFMIHGITPGPTMFDKHADLMGGIYAGMIIAAVLMLVIGWVCLPWFAKIAQARASYVLPVVLALCLTGSYLEAGSMFAVYLMLIFAALGFVMRKLEFPFVTFLVGFVVGPEFERALRQAVVIGNGEIGSLSAHPIAVGFLVLAVLAAWWLTRMHFRNVAPAGALEDA